MKMIIPRCEACGNPLKEKGEGRWYCDHCGNDNVDEVYSDAKAIQTAKLDAGRIENSYQLNSNNQIKAIQTTRSRGAIENRKPNVTKSVFTIILCVIVGHLLISLLFSNALKNGEIIDSPVGTTTITDNGYYTNGGFTSYDDFAGEVAPTTGIVETTTYLITTPISLLKLTPYTEQPLRSEYYDCSDIFGAEYDDGLYSYSEQGQKECSATYRLNSQYDTFTFTSGVTGRGTPGEAKIYVYGDGVLLYERTLTCTSESEFVQLNISGVKDLTIEMYGHTELEVSITGFRLLSAHIWNPRLK